MRLALLFIPLLAAVACSPFPEIAPAAADTGPYPVLQPLDDLLAQADGLAR
jgi:hypothetical protein